MRSNNRSLGKRILTGAILILGLVFFCLMIAILFSLPSRTAEIYGPPNPDLPFNKLYSQSLVLLLSREKLSQPMHPETTDITYIIESGDSLDRILAGMAQLGLINDSRTFRAYLIYSGIDTNIQAGEYQFSTGMTGLEIARLLGYAPMAKTTLSVLAGWRMEEIGESFSQIGIILIKEEFIDAVRSNQKEGYLFPGNYSVERDIQAEQLVDILFTNFITQITPEIESQYDDQGLSLHEAVILASIIEREAILEEEMPLIASVFLNRLRDNMNLAADPTVQYAIGFNTDQASWWTNPLSLEDLKIPSPFNTYENPGLPPGPICNPGKMALEAVANPAKTSFYFFRAACDGSGSHKFAETFAEHLENACE
jgi:UPF0755 protein